MYIMLLLSPPSCQKCPPSWEAGPIRSVSWKDMCGRKFFTAKFTLHDLLLKSLWFTHYMSEWRQGMTNYKFITRRLFQEHMRWWHEKGWDTKHGKGSFVPKMDVPAKSKHPSFLCAHLQWATIKDKKNTGERTECVFKSGHCRWPLSDEHSHNIPLTSSSAPWL